MIKKKILVVDDDRDFATSASAFLQGRGFDVALAGNSQEADALLAKNRPDLIVLDIMMDYDAEGFNFAYRVKNNAATAQIPIVIVSGYEKHLAHKYKSFELIQGQDWPAVQEFKKPVNLNELATSISQILAEAERSAPVLAAAHRA